MKMLILTKMGAIYYGDFIKPKRVARNKKILVLKDVTWKRHSKKHNIDLKDVKVNEQWINPKIIINKIEIEIDGIEKKKYKELLGLLK